eukprot:3573357-Pyramimonas_sp.AAC.3
MEVLIPGSNLRLDFSASLFLKRETMSSSSRVPIYLRATFLAIGAGSEKKQHVGGSRSFEGGAICIDGRGNQSSISGQGVLL